jgi:uncharacterized protein YfiM (DUF2279 family)
LKKLLLIFILLFTSSQLKAEDSLSVTRAAILGAGTIAGIALSYNFQSNEYWDDPAEWHLVSWRLEYDDALMADKLGHFYFSYALANSFSKVTEWSGLDREVGTWLGFGISMLHQTAVEIYDGYSDGRPYLGFSRGDMVANILGASYSVGQYYYPYLNNITPKISYYPYSSEEYRTVFNDYNATNHWFSFDVWSMSDELSTDWYNAFGLALGHSVSGIDRDGAGHHQFYLGLDVNWNYFKQFDIVKDSYYLQLIINILEKYKVPLPALRIGNNIRGFLIR